MKISYYNLKLPDKYLNFTKNLFSNNVFILTFLLLIKIILQLSVLKSGYQWLSADDFCRTVKSFEWMKNPQIYAGVWLTGQFWINGFVMHFVKDLFLSALIVNFFFSNVTLFYFYKAVEICFDRKTAIFSTLILCIFPFEVWLSISGLPESVFFFFIIASIYYFLKWKLSGGNVIFLLLSSISSALSGLFRYEGWLFSLTLLLFVVFEFFRNKKDIKLNVIYLSVSMLSFASLIFWIILNYIDYKDAFYFAKETSKIYEEFNTAKLMQKIIQYPTFIFYIAPITTVFSLKVIFVRLKKLIKQKNEKEKLVIYFLLFNLVELFLLMVQGMFGTGGTNMISRYIVINALLLLPFAVIQVFDFKKITTVIIFSAIIIINIIWCFYYPHPFRDDTYETGSLIKNQIARNYLKGDDKVYFEELQGYYDVFAIQTFSNDPSKFILGNFPLLKTTETKKKKKKNELSEEDLNVLDIKKFLEKNKITLAVVKSDSYVDKLKKMNLKNEEIGDYKIFYMKDFESNLNDSTISILAQNVEPPGKNPDMINFNKTIAVKDIRIDNSNFGFNPQTVTIDWCAVNKYIIDSLDYDNFEFDRYKALLEIKTVDTDSLVYYESKRIFGDRNIEDLIEKNVVRSIIVLRPFALVFYARKYSSSPFESGVYNLSLKVIDEKSKKELLIYKGDSLYKSSEHLLTDSAKTKIADSLKVKTKTVAASKDTANRSYNLGNIIAMFPDTNVDKLVKKKNINFYKIITQNGLQVFFSQRYQGDHFLDFVFTYF